MFSRSNSYTNCKSMNGPRFNHFWHYIFDLNNLKAIGKVRSLANPTKAKRLEIILKERLGNPTTSKEIVSDEKGEDEVTQIFYGDDCCICSRKSTCRTTKCSCYKKNKTCNLFCHTESSSCCKNK